MGCVVTLVKRFFGIGDELMWKQVFERKVMAEEIGLCFRKRTKPLEDDILWEMEAAIAALSCHDLDIKTYQNFTDKKSDDIQESEASSNDKCRDQNMNESSGYKTSEHLETLQNDGFRLRHRVDEVKPRHLPGDEDNATFPTIDYVFSKESEISSGRNHCFNSEEDLFELINSLSSEYECNFDDPSPEIGCYPDEQEDLALTDLFCKISEDLNSPRQFELPKEIGFDRNAMRDVCDTTLQTANESESLIDLPGNICNDIHLETSLDRASLVLNEKPFLEKDSCRDHQMREKSLRMPKSIEGIMLEGGYDNFSTINNFSLEYLDNDNNGSPASPEEEKEKEDKIGSGLSIDNVKAIQNRNSNMQNDNEEPDIAVMSDSIEISSVHEHDKGVVAKFWNSVKVKLEQTIFRDAAPVNQVLPVNLANIIGTDLNTRDYRAVFVKLRKVSEENDDFTKNPEDFLKFLDLIQFNLHDKHQNKELVGPCQRVARYFGLQRTQLPNNPLQHNTFENIVHEIERVMKIVSTPFIALYARSPNLSSIIGRRQTVQQLFLRGPMAYKFYEILTSIERVCIVDKLLLEREMVLKFYKWKHDTLMHVLRIAKRYYQLPSETDRYQWKILKQKLLSSKHASATDIAFSISAPPTRWPVFTCLIIIMQTAMLITLLCTRGLAVFGFYTESVVGYDVPTFLGYETKVFNKPANPWLGAAALDLINFGAVFGPCIHQTDTLHIRLSQSQRVRLDRRDKIGCCEILFPVHTAGTTTKEECRIMTRDDGIWNEGVSCGQDMNNTAKHILKPCCYGMLGDCLLASVKHCELAGGLLHTDCESCNQVNCQGSVCKMFGSQIGVSYDPASPWLDSKVAIWQQYRIVLSLIMSTGLIHLAILVVMEFVLMTTLEKAIGWLRISLIYISSGMCGALVHLAFQSERPCVGSTAGLMGVIGAAFLELSQAWKLIKHPCWEAFKLSILVFIIMLLGTLPLISLTAASGGLVTGVISGLLLLPYITFGGDLGYWRGRIVLFAFILWIATFASLIHIVFEVAPFDYCDVCHNLECYAYDKYICEREYIIISADEINVFFPF